MNVDDKQVEDNQKSIMRWLISLGHIVDHETRSCSTKKRYDFCPPTGPTMIAYSCSYCGGWHKATKKEK